MATRYVCECGDSFTHKEKEKVQEWFAAHVRKVHTMTPLRVWASYAPSLTLKQNKQLRELLLSWGVQP